MFRSSVLILSLLVAFLANCDRRVDQKHLPAVQSASFVGGDKAFLLTRSSQLYSTKDGGKKWDLIKGSVINDLERIKFIDAGRGWGVNGEGEVYGTTDGGHSWSLLSRLKPKDDHFNSAGEIGFLDERHGWIVETFSFWRTSDGGSTWKQSPPEQLAGAPSCSSFVTPRTGWLGYQSGFISLTRDGGQSWEAKAVSSREDTCYGLFFIDENNGWANLRPYGGLFRTQDGGKSWHPIGPLKESGKYRSWNSIFFVSKTEGWVVGQAWEGDEVSMPGDKRRGVVFKTQDGGQNWEAVDTGHQEGVYSEVSFSDKNNGWLVGKNKVYRTENGGKDWVVSLEM